MLFTKKINLNNWVLVAEMFRIKLLFWKTPPSELLSSGVTHNLARNTDALSSMFLDFNKCFTLRSSSASLK